MLHFEHQCICLTSCPGYFLFALLGVRNHGSEFVHHESAPVFPDAPLFEENGARGCQINNRSDKKKDHAHTYTAHDTSKDIKNPFEKQVTPGDIPQTRRDGGFGTDPLDILVACLQFLHPRNSRVNRDTHIHDLVDQIHGQIFANRNIHINFIYPVIAEIVNEILTDRDNLKPPEPLCFQFP